MGNTNDGFKGPVVGHAKVLQEILPFVLCHLFVYAIIIAVSFFVPGIFSRGVPNNQAVVAATMPAEQ